jgi:hypothetical protein
MKISAEEIEQAKSEKGGWTKKALAVWGVPWPPPKGWKESLINGMPLAEQTFSTEAMKARYSDSPEAKLLHKVVIAVIETGHSDILASIPEVNNFYGGNLPKVSDFVTSQNYKLSGGLELDDKVYRFDCIRKTRKVK